MCECKHKQNVSFKINKKSVKEQEKTQKTEEVQEEEEKERENLCKETEVRQVYCHLSLCHATVIPLATKQTTQTGLDSFGA